MDLKSVIEDQLKQKRALKIIVAMHAVFIQGTDPTFLSKAQGAPLSSIQESARWSLDCYR